MPQPKESFWDKVADLFEGEDEDVVLSAKARVLANRVTKRLEELEKPADKPHKLR